MTSCLSKSEQYIYARFPESLFQAEDSEKAVRRIFNGLKAASELNVVIAGICRNVEPSLDHTISRLYHMSQFFNDYKIIIYENDSTDGTSERLRKHAHWDRNFILLQDTTGHKQYRGFDAINPEGAEASLERAEYLASLRNIYLRKIRELNSVFPVDYAIIVDLDLMGGWSYDGILDSFSYPGWSAMTGNGLLFREKKVTLNGHAEIEYERLFFDTWAYREYGTELLPPSDETNLKNFERGEPPFEVFSNFNGIAIYKYSDLEKCEYGAGDNGDDTVTCDHPFLHKQMRDLGCNIYLNPSMISLYSPHEFSAQL